MKYLFFLFTISPFFIFSQIEKTAISLEVAIDDEDYNSKKSVRKITSFFGKKYSIWNEAPVNVYINLTPGDIKTITGMDTYSTTNIDVEYTIKSNGNTIKETGQIKSKGNNEKDLLRKIGTSFVRDKKMMKAITSSIDKLVSDQFSSCDKIKSYISTHAKKGKLDLANAAFTYYDNLSNCDDQKSFSESELLEIHVIQACDKTIQRAKILANSGSKEKLNEAVSLLLLIPYDAPCNDQVIEVSETINANALKINKHASNQISERIIIREKMSVQEWRAYYYKNYRKYR